MPVRRLLLVILLYAVGAVLLDGVLRWLEPLLVLPPSFLVLGRILLVLGFVLAVVLAWRYEPAEDSGRAGPER